MVYHKKELHNYFIPCHRKYTYQISWGIRSQCTMGRLSLIPWNTCIYVAVNFCLQLIFILPLFLGMVMYDNEFKTKEKEKLTEEKN